MTKIAMYNVSPIEVPYIEDWAKKNDVEIKTTDQALTSATVDLAEGCSSVSLKPLGPVDEEVVY
ncbi:MAG: D-2-hydroxyacid dehydrogenase, partial [Lactobacillus delbrueckii]